MSAIRFLEHFQLVNEPSFWAEAEIIKWAGRLLEAYEKGDKEETRRAILGLYYYLLSLANSRKLAEKAHLAEQTYESFSGSISRWAKRDIVELTAKALAGGFDNIERAFMLLARIAREVLGYTAEEFDKDFRKLEEVKTAC